MTFFNYDDNVPNASNNPSADVGDMTSNTQAINGIINEDHISFNANNGGYHKQAKMFNQSPPALGGANGIYFVNNNLPYFENAAGSFPFGVIIQQAVVANGYLQLGALIIQWGINTSVTSGSFSSGEAEGTVTYNTPFGTAAYTVYTVPFYTTTPPNGSGSVQADSASVGSTANFNWNFTSNSGKFTGFYWLAIGA